MEGLKKTEYFFVVTKRLKRRIWEDEDGTWYTFWWGKKEKVDKEHSHALIKHQEEIAKWN